MSSSLDWWRAFSVVHVVVHLGIVIAVDAW